MPVISLRLPVELHEAAKAKLVNEKRSFQDMLEAAVREYVAPAPSLSEEEEFQQAMAIAREGMRKYNHTLRELAK